jgi:hypothetical protein
MKYWSKELLNAFTDLLHKCTHCLKMPVGMQNLFIEDSGIKLYFKGLVYGDIRPEYSHDEAEASYLVMFSKMLLELITNDCEFSDFPNLAIDINLKCIIEECTKAYSRYQDRRDEELQQETKKSTKEISIARKLDTEASRIKENNRAAEKKARLPLKKMAEPGYLNDHLTFMRLQSHPYFSAQDHEVDLAIIMEEYERLFGVSK